MDTLTFLAIAIITAAIYFIFWLASLFIKSQSCYKTTSDINNDYDFIEQDFITIKRKLEVWDRWGFDPKTNLFIGFTLHDIYDDGSEGFKPKMWIKGNKETFNRLMTFEIPRRLYTKETEYFIKRD